MLIRADARQIPLRDGCVQCVVTSPPYWGLRDYGTAKWDGGDIECDHSTPRSRGDDTKPGDKQGTSAGSRPNTQLVCVCGARRVDNQIGLESTPDAYVQALVSVFREVWRVLTDDGVLWLNLGDSYASTDKTNRSGLGASGLKRNVTDETSRLRCLADNKVARGHVARIQPDCKPKDLCGIPWRVAFALQAEGWYLRSDIIWSKPNPMPESVTDRPTKAHEYVFLLSKRERYYYDADAIRDPLAEASIQRVQYGWQTNRMNVGGSLGRGETVDTNMEKMGDRFAPSDGRNARSVWTITTQPYPDAHFATFPEALPERCIKAGSRISDLVFDPFIGSGTTGAVAERLGRRWVGLDLAYHHLSSTRTAQRGLRWASI